MSHQAAPQVARGVVLAAVGPGPALLPACAGGEGEEELVALSCIWKDRQRLKILWEAWQLGCVCVCKGGQDRREPEVWKGRPEGNHV